MIGIELTRPVRDLTLIAAAGLAGEDGLERALLAERATWFAHALDAEAMHQAAQVLLGENDFSAFRAAESGRWTGVWKDRQMGGTYLAVWRKVTGQWVIESELYITLADQPLDQPPA